MIYDPFPLVKRIEEGTLSIQDARNHAVSKVKNKALELGMPGLYDNPWGRKGRRAQPSDTWMSSINAEKEKENLEPHLEGRDDQEVEKVNVCLPSCEVSVAATSGTTRNGVIGDTVMIPTSTVELLSLLARIRLPPLPTRSRLLSLPTRVRLLALPTRTRLLSLPTRVRLLDLPARTRLLDLPARTRLLDLPARTRLLSLPARTRLLSLPARTRLLSLPTMTQLIVPLWEGVTGPMEIFLTMKYISIPSALGKKSLVTQSTKDTCGYAAVDATFSERMSSSRAGCILIDYGVLSSGQWSDVGCAWHQRKG
jgi:hypothetical protein